jgi:NAD(P)-dependent dehydrogenase (short-subunit alcohol dehydrogenase family)
MKQLSNRLAWITGGGSGIGLAVARAFLAEGARVVISGRDPDKLRKDADTLGAGDALLSVPLDVGEPDQVRAAIDLIRQHFAADVDILVNNAGINLKARAARELTAEQWRTLIRTNLDGAFFCIQAVLPRMRERRDGLIIHVNSVSGLRAVPLGGAGYVASKFGLRGLATCLAEEEREHGIRVSSIFPGEVDTPILDQRPQPVSPERRQVILRPEDVAAAVLFVATLPPRVSIPELVIKPTVHAFV